MTTPDRSSEWRTSAAAKVSTGVVVAVFIAAGAAIAIGAGSEGDVVAALITFVVVAVASTAAVAYAFRCKVVCAPSGLEIVNTIRRRKFGWHEIAHAEPGYWGLSVELKNGRQVVATAVQKSNVARWTNRHTRADDLADRINSRVSRNR